MRDDQTADHVKTSVHVLGDPIHHMRYTVQACLVAHLREHECDTLKHSVQRIKVKLVLAGTFKVFDDFSLDYFVNLKKSLAHFLVQVHENRADAHFHLQMSVNLFTLALGLPKDRPQVPEHPQVHSQQLCLGRD